MLDTAHVGTGVWAIGTVDVPGDEQAHRIEATRRDAREVIGRDEGLTMATDHLGIRPPTERRDEGGLVEGTRARKYLRRDPRFERQPTGEVDAMAQPVLADGCGEKVLGPRLVDDAIEGGSDRNVARHSPCTPSTQARPRR